MGSSITGELVELSDTALEESWDSLSGKINEKIDDKNTIRGGAKKSNMHPVSFEYESETLGPASTRGRVNQESGQRKVEPPSETNREWPIVEQEEKDDWPLRETNLGALSTRKGTKSPQEGNSRQNPRNKERGEAARSDHNIGTINASLLAAVKALTWQSHKMEIDLELTHMLAQSIIALARKLNALCGKLDNWDHSWRKDGVAAGSRIDEIDKLVTLPDLLTSIIQHCKMQPEPVIKQLTMGLRKTIKRLGLLSYSPKDE
ncbi:hypothetical protein NDU88_003919 [Pleurodeles waltl]|uniref:Uncharacterized protein n=1 Tax=Pleurodeles waltl TaxID=8319 RepID=A0AAV7L0E9_PLEWA|nr:hypothetical protein NDU88_003919 [Pleurodeles waltl]